MTPWRRSAARWRPDHVPAPTRLADRAAFSVWVREITRFGDTDALGHVNNATFATFTETARVLFLVNPEAPLKPPGCTFVIARLVLDFRAELQWNETVDIGTLALGIGRSSFTLGHGMFRGVTCVATAETVLVLIDETTRRSTPLPQSLRARLDAVLLDAPPASS